jgi:DNA repair protein RecO (recombination protein O)
VSAPRRSQADGRRSQPALCLRRFPYGESSLVLHVLAPEAGRVALLAKGAYRPSSGFFAVFDLFDTLDVRWNARAGGELGLVTRAALRRRRPALASDLERYRIALGLLELAHLSAREEHEERELFRWLEDALDLLQGGRATPAAVAVAADLALLRANGLAPALATCASCGERCAERAGRVPFSAALGGRLCPSCAAAEAGRDRARESLPLNVLRVAESLMAATPTMLEHTRIEAGLLGNVRAFVERFLAYHLETRSRSRAGGSARGRR